MVTGIETAGLILAIFPLIISTLEHYKEGFSTLQTWWMYRTEFLDFLRKIGIQSVLFRGNLEELLAPIVASEAQMNALLLDPGGDVWGDEKLEENLRKRLPKTYDWYKLTIDEMLKDMTRLKKKLNIHDGKPLSISNDSSKTMLDWWKNELGRVAFALNKKTRAKLLKQLGKHNENLEKLLQSSDRIALSISRRISRVPERLRPLCKQACRLHHALTNGWQCSCQIYHSSNLALRLRTSIPEDSKRSASSYQAEFHILFHHGSNPSPWTWRETNIKISEVETKPPDLPMSTDVVSMLTSSTSWATTSSTVTATSKKLRFDLGQDSYDLGKNEKQLVEISSLCNAIRDADQTLSCLGFLRDAEQWRYTLHPVVDDNDSVDYTKAVALESLLEQSHGAGGSPLSRRQRFYIAMLLSVSVLQLHSTPWFGQSWDKKKILLLCNEDDGSVPAVSHIYMVPDEEVSARRSTDSTKIIFALGVMLLELCFGKRLEDYPSWGTYLGADGKPNEHTGLATARDWQSKVLPEAGPEYAEAIRKCLLCAFATQSTNLGDTDMMNAFYNGVVKTVQDYWRFGYGNASLEM